MKHSGPAAGGPGHAGARIVLVGTDVAALAALPAAVVLLGRGDGLGAVFAAVASSAATLARAFAVGASIDGALVRTWRRAVDASTRRSVVEIAGRRERDESLALLFESAREVALHDALVVPQLVARSIVLAGIVVATLVLLDARWLVLELCGLSGLALVFAVTSRRVRAAQGRAWEAASDLAVDARALMEAAVELRARGREAAVADRVLERARSVARAERRALVWGALTSLLPASLGVLAFALHARLGGQIASSLAGRAGDVGVLGTMLALTAISLGRGVEAAHRTAPIRATLEAYEKRAHERALTGGHHVDLAAATIELDHVSFRYPGASRSTPHDVSFAWSPGRGLGILGDNGAGKSTLGLLLLGLLRPTAGRIRVAGHELAGVDVSDLRRQVAYLPQTPLFAPGATMGWHVEIGSGARPASGRFADALERVGLAPRVASHGDVSALDVPVAELSGGERKRFHLARILLDDAPVVLLDEPEAGLDAAGRRMLLGLLDELATKRRVIAIVHDETVLPASFERLRCVPSSGA